MIAKILAILEMKRKMKKIIMHEIQNKHIFEEIAAAASIFIFPV